MDPAKRCWGNDLGKLALRLAIGGLMLFHGVGKIMHGIEPIKQMMTANGAPEFLAYGVYIGEVLAPILILIGLWTRIGAVILLIDMIVAVVMVHRADVATLNTQSGGYTLELQALYLLGALAIMLMGAGHISIDGARRRMATTSAPLPVETRSGREMR